MVHLETCKERRIVRNAEGDWNIKAIFSNSAMKMKTLVKSCLVSRHSAHTRKAIEWTERAAREANHNGSRALVEA